MNKFEIENLELYYGDFKALKNINMNISPNEITAFIGPSGCGKSTLLKTLDRMNDLVDTCKINGSVKYDGKDIYSYDINELRKNVAMVFQKPNPFAMSIYDNVAYGPKTHGIRSKKELDEIVEKSLRQAALWDEVGDKLKRAHLPFRAVNSKGFALHVPLPLIPMLSLWMSLLLPSTLFQHLR